MNRRTILEKIKVGVIGVGHLGRFHTLNYAQIPDAELIGVYDMDKERASTVAAEGQCRAYDDIGTLLKDVEAVSVVVPTDKHFDVGKQVVEAKVHCLVEKPIAQNLKEADELIRLARDNGVILQVGHVERFNPAMIGLKDMEMNPRFIESHRLAPFNPRGTEVAVVLDLMIHDIDAILSLVDSPVTHVDASGVAVVSESIDIANARITFENGCVANLTASRISQKKMRKMRLFQKDAYIAIDFLDKTAEVFQLSADSEPADMVMGEIGVGDRARKILFRRPECPQEGGLHIELEAFIHAIQGQTTPAVTGEDGRAALAVAFQVLEKMG